MIDGVHKLVGAEPVVSRRHIHLERQHIGRRKLLSRFKHAVDAIRPPRRVPVGADRIFVAVWSDAPIGGWKKSPGRGGNKRPSRQKESDPLLLGLVPCPVPPTAHHTPS